MLIDLSKHQRQVLTLATSLEYFPFCAEDDWTLVDSLLIISCTYHSDCLPIIKRKKKIADFCIIRHGP